MHVAWNPLGTSEILRVKLWQHKLKISRGILYRRVQTNVHMKWNYIKTLTEKQSPSE